MNNSFDPRIRRTFLPSRYLTLNDWRRNREAESMKKRRKEVEDRVALKRENYSKNVSKTFPVANKLMKKTQTELNEKPNEEISNSFMKLLTKYEETENETVDPELQSVDEHKMCMNNSSNEKKEEEISKSKQCHEESPEVAPLSLFNNQWTQRLKYVACFAGLFLSVRSLLCKMEWNTHSY